MKETLIHNALEEQGLKVISVSSDGRVELEGATKQQQADAVTFARAFTLPTREEALAKIRANRDALIEELLLARHYPFVLEEKRVTALDRGV